jgi:hypothetical protein
VGGFRQFWVARRNLLRTNASRHVPDSRAKIATAKNNVNSSFRDGISVSLPPSEILYGGRAMIIGYSSYALHLHFISMSSMPPPNNDRAAAWQQPYRHTSVDNAYIPRSRSVTERVTSP